MGYQLDQRVSTFNWLCNEVSSSRGHLPNAPSGEQGQNWGQVVRRGVSTLHVMHTTQHPVAKQTSCVDWLHPTCCPLLRMSCSCIYSACLCRIHAHCGTHIGLEFCTEAKGSDVPRWRHTLGCIGPSLPLLSKHKGVIGAGRSAKYTFEHSG